MSNHLQVPESCSCKAKSAEAEQVQQAVFVRLSLDLYVSATRRVVLRASIQKVHVLLAATLTDRLLLLPAADGVGVLHYDLVHPREGLREQNSSLEKAHVAPMLSQGKYHIGHFL